MKKNLSFLYCLIPLCVGTACTDDVISEYDAIETPQSEVCNGSLQLLDAEGNAVDYLSPNWNRYYLQVNEPGEWELKGEGGFVVPTITHGEGPQLVPVIVGENWTTAREGGLKLITYGTAEGGTRANSDTSKTTKTDSTKVTVSQMSNANLDDVKKILSSNKGAGYGYSFNGDYCLGTTIEIFNMRALDALQEKDGYHLIDDDYNPDVKTTMVTGSSKQECNTKLAIDASLGVEYNKVNVKVKGHYTSDDQSSSKKAYARSRICGHLFTREVLHSNILGIARADSSGKLYQQLYSPGFRMVCEKLKNDLIQAIGKDLTLKPNAKSDSICKNFCEEVGPCLIRKAVMGCCLDYSMSIDSSALKTGMTCGGSLDLKIKVATASVDVNAKGDYATKMDSVESHAEFECSVYGGEVMGVSILASGGTLSGSAVTVWQQSVLPRTAVLVDVVMEPIYSVIYDEKVQAILEEYVKRMLSADSKKTE